MRRNPQLRILPLIQHFLWTPDRLWLWLEHKESEEKTWQGTVSIKKSLLFTDSCMTDNMIDYPTRYILQGYRDRSMIDNMIDYPTRYILQG